jgi:hypothetical protein
VVVAISEDVVLETVDDAEGFEVVVLARVEVVEDVLDVVMEDAVVPDVLKSGGGGSQSGSEESFPCPFPKSGGGGSQSASEA